MHCMLSAITCATAHSPRPLDAAPGPCPSKMDAKRNGRWYFPVPYVYSGQEIFV